MVRRATPHNVKTAAKRSGLSEDQMGKFDRKEYAASVTPALMRSRRRAVSRKDAGTPSV